MEAFRLAFVILVASTGLLAGCQTVPADNLAEQRAAIDAREKNSLEKLYATNPDAKAEIEGAVGHAVFAVTSVNALVLVGQEGKGVLVEHASGKRTYMTMIRAGTGPGVGYQELSQVIAFKSAAAVDQFKLGGEVGGDVVASATLGSSNVQGSIDPFIRYWHINEKGFAVQANWGGAVYAVDSKLNAPAP
jgi:lipid-binding SYLF domain-containing protein